MQKKTSLWLILVATVFTSVFTCMLLAACIPYYYTHTPGLYGKVIDDATGSPISGATIYFEGHSEKRAIADSNGEFDLPQKKGWILVPLGPFDAIPRLVLVIEARGYNTYKTANWGSRVFRLQKSL